LDNLWKGLASLPAKFPDGKPLDQTAYPWLLNSLVCRYFERLKKRSLFVYGKEFITIFLAWYVVPITMAAFWLRYIPRHDWWGTIMHIALIALSIGFAFISYRLCGLTLRGKEETIFKLSKFWKGRRFYYDAAILVVIVTVFLLLSFGAIKGVRLANTWEGEAKVNYGKIKEVIPWFFDKLGYEVFANFSEKRVSEIPPNYFTINKEERLEIVEGANLKDMNLNYANMYGAFLVKTNLRGAYLEYSNLHDSNLQNANLMDAKLNNAYLGYANLAESNLERTILWFANLEYSNLQEADLRNAKLQEAVLRNANLQRAKLEGANLLNADLLNANNLTTNQLSKVFTLYKTNLDHELFREILKCCPNLLEERIMPKALKAIPENNKNE
jgi:hypothetical protein